MITPVAALMAVVMACGLDRLLGDPRGLPHPVVLMGWWITRLRRVAEAVTGDAPPGLRLSGLLITLLLVTGSAAAGWTVERLALRWPVPGGALLVIALASALAGRSLELEVEGVLSALGPEASPGESGLGEAELEGARRRLAWIVGRDVEGLGVADLLRAAAETAAENAVDGLFAPLFWMLVGTALWSLNAAGPGPLALAWAFKAASTLDSMLGYRQGRLRWLGTAGARLDDLLTWLPSRLVALSLPLVSRTGWERPWRSVALLRLALRDGAADPSPNAGVSQAAYAHAVGVQLGGTNLYGGVARSKPLVGKGLPAANRAAVERILELTRRLEALWLVGAGLAVAGLGLTTAVAERMGAFGRC